MGINRTVFADNSSCGRYSLRPMNAVVTRMDVLQNEKDEILAMLVEVYESQQNIEECIVDLSGTFAIFIINSFLET